MIVLDTEFSGLNEQLNGMWQIGAIEFENPMNQFIQEGRIDGEDEVEAEAMKITGMTEIQLRDPKKQSQMELINNFFKWIKSVKVKNIIGQNPSSDYWFMRAKSAKYGLHNPRDPRSFPLPYRMFDLHSVAQTVHFRLHGKFLVNEGKSNMGLGNVLKMVGMEDHRMKLQGSEVVKQGSPHNALEDAKLTAEAFSRLTTGRNLLPEFSKFTVPSNLIQLNNSAMGK